MILYKKNNQVYYEDIGGTSEIRGVPGVQVEFDDNSLDSQITISIYRYQDRGHKNFFRQAFDYDQVFDENSVAYGVSFLDVTFGFNKGTAVNIQDENGAYINNLNLFPTHNFLFEIGRGNIPGAKMYSIPGRKDSLSTSVLDDLTQIPGVTVVPSPGGIQLEVVSSNAQDDNDTGGGTPGTGVLSVDVHYLDTAGAEQTETVILSGLTPVNTTAVDIDFIQWMHTKTLGTGGVAAGNISLRNTAGSVTYEYISAGGNQSLSGRYKVPTGKTGYVVGWQASGITKKIDLRLRATVERFDRSLIPGIFLFQDILVLNNTSSGYIPFPAPLKMPATAQIKMSAISATADGDGAGKFDIVLIDD